MKWIYVALFGAFAIVVIRTFFRGAGSRIDGLEFEHWVHSFLKVKKDGGTMTFSHVGSPVFVRFRREAGTEDACHLLVDVPRAGWSEPHFEDLERRVDSMGLSTVSPRGAVATEFAMSRSPVLRGLAAGVKTVIFDTPLPEVFTRRERFAQRAGLFVGKVGDSIYDLVQ